ncbi:uncharacterized protein [Miscanthus floridulus]|uniref:uncharacterized protein n=1 Tax=Miscanthus floridulus TaxID=154761 RepID=UPI0034598A57
MEPSPSPSSTDSSSDDDESEAGRGPLDHLPDVRGTAPGASASGPAFPRGGGEDASGLAIACPGAEADMSEARTLGKRAVSLMGSTAEVERATAGATQQPPQRVEGASKSSEGRPTPVDMGAVPPPPPPPLRRMRDAVRKLLCPHSSQKHQAKAPTLVPCKALKVSTSSTARWVVEVQAAIQRGTTLARVDPKEPVAQGEATEAATKQAGQEAPMPREAEAHESDEAEAPLVAEATKGKESAREVEVHSISSNDTSWGKEVVDAEAASTAEQPALTSGEGSSALIWSAEVEDLRLRYADMKAEVATAREQATPLAARIKELEEELTRVAGERDTFRSWAEQVEASVKAVAGQLGRSRLEKEVTRVAEASVAVQAVLEAKIREHNVL